MHTPAKHTENQSAKPTTANGTFFGSGGGRAPFFQAKLTVNQPGDAHEREADAVADQVMRMKTGDAPIIQRMPLTPTSAVQRACANCEKEKESVQRKETGGGDASGKAAPSIVSNVLSSSGGHQMDGSTRQFMESRFGQDFSQVRIHTDSRAAESASAIQARAYTSGRNVVFGSGEYQPSSESGQRLLAHELVHVGQQGGGNHSLQRQASPPQPTTVHQVTLDLLSFRGSNRSPYPDVAEANRIFQPCGVVFMVNKGLSVSPRFSDPLMGPDTTFERENATTDSAEEQALLPAIRRTFGLNSRLKVLYFEQINPGARGTSHRLGNSTTITRDHIYMTNTAAPRTLAHEIGHILLDGNFHHLPSDNLMHPSDTATGSNLTPQQCSTIISNI
jgi:hypothetical protein